MTCIGPSTCDMLARGAETKAVRKVNLIVYLTSNLLRLHPPFFSPRFFFLGKVALRICPTRSGTTTIAAFQLTTSRSRIRGPLHHPTLDLTARSRLLPLLQYFSLVLLPAHTDNSRGPTVYSGLECLRLEIRLVQVAARQQSLTHERALATRRISSNQHYTIKRTGLSRSSRTANFGRKPAGTLFFVLFALPQTVPQHRFNLRQVHHMPLEIAN